MVKISELEAVMSELERDRTSLSEAVSSNAVLSINCLKDLMQRQELIMHMRQSTEDLQLHVNTLSSQVSERENQISAYRTQISGNEKSLQDLEQMNEVSNFFCYLVSSFSEHFEGVIRIEFVA